MIIIVDEDIIQMGSLKTEFELRGYSSLIIPNADEAWETLIRTDEIEVVIIDIMLAARSHQSRYDREKSQDYTTTGICLAHELLDQFEPKFSRKLVYLSHTNENGIIDQIEKSSSERNVPFFRKHDYSSDMKLAEDILNIIDLPLENIKEV